MTSPETRRVHTGLGDDRIDQTAIPWCTVHDASKIEADWRPATCGAGDGQACLISTGGPDHKWWRDP